MCKINISCELWIFWEENGIFRKLVKFLFFYLGHMCIFMSFSKKIFSISPWIFFYISNIFQIVNKLFFQTLSFYHQKAPSTMTQLWTWFIIIILKSLVKMTIYIRRFRITAKVASPIPAAINTMVPIMIHISLLLPVITIVPIISHPPF